MDLVVRFTPPFKGQLKFTTQSMPPSRIGFYKGLTGLLVNFYNSNSTAARFLNLFRVQPLSILAPFQRRQAGRGV
jgi:hypothetical protein